MYFSISLLREKWKQRSLFADADRTTASGFDLYAAAAELFDDVVAILAYNTAQAAWRPDKVFVTSDECPVTNSLSSET